MKGEISCFSLIEKIEETLERLLPMTSCPYQSLYEGARYALFSGGKRIRPLLTLTAVQMLKGSVENALIPACCIELIHTYSLVHDDLPCMDDDDFRRGKPTVHKVYSEGLAVLIGDHLLTFAFEALSTAPHLSAEQRLALTRLLAKASGAEGMIGGQVLDLYPSSATSLTELHRRKTGALFQACLGFSGILCNSDALLLSHLLSLGGYIGSLFQMIDDFIDGDNDFSLPDIERAHQEVLKSLSQLPGDKKAMEELLRRILAQIHQLEAKQWQPT